MTEPSQPNNADILREIATTNARIDGLETMTTIIAVPFTIALAAVVITPFAKLA